MRKRDYKAEYRRRIERAAARRLTRSQARGHARAGEAPIRANSGNGEQRLRSGLKHFLKHGQLSAAAKAAGISPERLRRHVHEQKLAERRGRRLRPIVRQIRIITHGRERWIKVGADAASRVGQYLDAVGKFLATNDLTLLGPFAGQSVTDLSGRQHPFETDPNILYELRLTRPSTYEQVYRLTAL